MKIASILIHLDRYLTRVNEKILAAIDYKDSILSDMCFVVVVLRDDLGVPMVLRSVEHPVENCRTRRYEYLKSRCIKHDGGLQVSSYFSGAGGFRVFLWVRKPNSVPNTDANTYKVSIFYGFSKGSE